MTLYGTPLKDASKKNKRDAEIYGSPGQKHRLFFKTALFFINFMNRGFSTVG